MTKRENNLIKPGWYMFRANTIFQVTAVDQTSGTLAVKETLSNEVHHLKTEDLFKSDGDEDTPVFAPTIEKLRSYLESQQPLVAVNFMDLPEVFLKRADRIINIVETVDQELANAERHAIRYGESLKHTAVLKRILQELDTPIGLTTYYDYRWQYQQYNGNRGQIAANMRRVTYNQLRVTSAQLHLADTLIQQYYSRSNPLDKREVFRVAQTVMKRTRNYWINPQQGVGAVPITLVENLLDERIPIETILNNPDHKLWLTQIILPSERWFYKYLRYFENLPDQGKAVITTRYGEEAWDRINAVYDSFFHTAQAPLQQVFADHWPIDLFILDKNDQLLRLWLTVLIDANSRSILGFALLNEHPCIESIQSALHHAIWPKTSHMAFGLDQEWVCYGIPVSLSLDNAWAHQSHSVEDLARTISQNGRFNAINLVFRPPYSGRYGGLIEVVFRKFSAKMKQHLDGAIRSSDKRDIRNAKTKARLLKTDLDRFIHELFLEHQHTPHEGLNGMTPHDKWLEGMRLGMPLIPKLTPGIERLFWRMHHQRRQISNKGISIFGLNYWSPELNGLERINKNGQRITFSIRYDPADISRVAIFRDGAWIGDVFAKELRLADGTTQSLSLAERKIAQKMARLEGEPASNWLQFTNFWERTNQTRGDELKQRQRLTKRPSEIETQEAADKPSEDMNSLYTDLLKGFSSN